MIAEQFEIDNRRNSRSNLSATNCYVAYCASDEYAKTDGKESCWSLIRICRNIGHCESMTIPFPSRLFDQFSQSVIDERLRGSLIFFFFFCILYFVYSLSLYTSLRKHNFLRTFFGSANDLQSFEYRSAIVHHYPISFFLWLLLHSLTHFHLLSSAIFAQYTQQKLSNDQTILLVIPSKRCAI